MASILHGDFARGERFDFMDRALYVEDTTKPSADVKRGLLSHPLPLVVGTRRLRLAYMERIEILYWVNQHRLETWARFHMAARLPTSRFMAKEMSRRLIRLCPDPGRLLMDCWTRIDETSGNTADQGTRDTFSKLLGAAHLWPGENELYYTHMLQIDPNTPPMHLAPLADEVIHTFRGHDYTKMVEYHTGKTLMRIERDFWPAHAETPAVAPRIERAALLYGLTLLDMGMVLLHCPAHHLPTSLAYWDELEQYQTGAIRLPPSTPEAALTKYGEAYGARCALVRLWRRHYLVRRSRVPPYDVQTLALPHHVASAMLVWMASVSPAVYPVTPASRLPKEIVPVVEGLRRTMA
jgi:hypothetical protein